MQTFDKWESFIEAHIHVRGWETKEQVTAQDPKLCLPLQYHPTPNKSFLHSVPTYNRNPWSHPHSCSLFRESASCRLNGKGFFSGTDSSHTQLTADTLLRTKRSGWDSEDQKMKQLTRPFLEKPQHTHTWRSSLGNSNIEKGNHFR